MSVATEYRMHENRIHTQSSSSATTSISSSSSCYFRLLLLFFSPQALVTRLVAPYNHGGTKVLPLQREIGQLLHTCGRMSVVLRVQPLSVPLLSMRPRYAARYFCSIVDADA